MRFSHFTAAAIVWAVCATAASAQATASEKFSDIPAGHWAEAAVTRVAVERNFMQAYADGTFRGDAPFTRLQLALAMSELVRELEAATKTQWAVKGLGGYEFQDLPRDPATRATVLKLANDYRVFEGVPGVTSRTFEGEKQVTRYEMAKVVNRLLRLGEERGVVDPAVAGGQEHTFVDMPASAWAANEVKEVADRYGVMVGFPDATFRGPEELTRFQFAATASQTFPLVRQLVEKTREKQEEATGAAAAARFLEANSFMLGGGARFVGGSPVVGGLGRGAAYFGSLFALGDGYYAPLSSGAMLAGGSLNLGYALPLGETLHLQPYLGGRAIQVMPAGGSALLGGLNYGLVGYMRPSERWGFYTDLNGVSPLGASVGNPQGQFYGRGGVGVEYFFTPKFGVLLEGGYALLPTVALGAGTATYGAEAAPYGGLGLTFGF